MAVKTVWIEEGCIMCNACESTCPDVFQVTDTSSTIKGSVRQDGLDGVNRDERSPLKPECQEAYDAGIREAANGCPMEVIHFE